LLIMNKNSSLPPVQIDVTFYALSFSTLGKALPKLLEKIYESGRRAVVLFGGEEQMEAVNTTLWTYSTMAFLPHASKNNNLEASRQPIWLTTTLENPNQAEVLLVTSGQLINFEDGDCKFNKFLDLFDSNNPMELENARERFVKYKTQGIVCNYWKQGPSGEWTKGD